MPGQLIRLLVAATLVLMCKPAMAKDAVKVDGKVYILPDGEELDLADQAKGLHACLKKHCLADIQGAEQFDTCRHTKCRADNRVGFELDSIHYNGKTVEMNGSLRFEAAAWGKQRSKPLFVGMTLFKQNGVPIDIPAQTVKGKKRNGPVRLVAKAGPGVTGYIVTAWRKKVKPCKDARPGCKKFGYILDDRIKAYPSDAYEGWDETIFARLPGGQGKVTVRVLAAGASETVLAAAVEGADKILAEELKLYGRPHGVERGGDSKTPRQVVEILYKHAQDEGLARSIEGGIRETLRKPKTVQMEHGKTTTIQVPPRPKYKVTHWPKAPANFVIAAGKKAKKK
jgi:hypothetical protein